MLKSRRGLLAAGLAVAVVGALGVASTLNAGAEQIAGASDQQPAAAAPTSSDDATDAAGNVSGDVSTPPTVLPWGARPERVRKGRAGVSARTLRSDGFDAASNDTSGSTQPRGRYAPKGDAPRNYWARGKFARGGSDVAVPVPVAPPSPEASSSAPAKCSDNPPCYLYDGAQQQAETDGAYANMTIGRPVLDKVDYHTLGEIAVQSTETGDAVELGWTVDRTVNGDDDPHLFVYHWVGHQESCYNGCGFVQYSKNLKPGDTLSYGVTKKFGIQYFNGSWWVAFDSEWIGYFPGNLWTDQGITFTRTGWVQVYGEVASATESPCTDMGTGAPGDSSTAAAYMASISYLNGPPVSPIFKNSPYYPVWLPSPRTFRYGGKGPCGAPLPTATPTASPTASS